jgi:hypothetical protein
VKLGELVADAVRRLDQSRVPYMVTGSVASSYYGEPRATLDLDIVIDPAPDALELLVAGYLTDRWYVDRMTAFDALRDHTQFNVVGPGAAKVDYLIRRDRPFSREEFERRRQVDLLGTPAWIATVEDMIVTKLEWSIPIRSERQIRDVAAMIEVSGDSIDRRYVERWVRDLGLEDGWERATSPST